MALNIGDVNLSLGVDHSDLQSAMRMLDKFGAALDRVATVADKGAQQTARAMARQEATIRKNAQALLSLNSAVMASNLSDKQKNDIIAETNTAYRQLVTQLGQTKVSQLELSRAADSFTAKLGTQRRSLNNLKIEKAQAAFHGLGVALKNAESASVLAIGPLSGVGARIRALGAIANRSQLHIAALIGAITGLVIGTFKLVRAMFDSGRAMQKITARMDAASGSAKKGAQNLAFVKDIANELGLDLKKTALQFGSLTAATRGTSLEGQKTRDVFRGIAVAATALRLGADETEGALRAVQQMASKGTVQAEELRGQLAERLPGAFNIAARAMGVTTEELGKMLESGSILAEDLLPKMGRVLEKEFGAAAARNAKGLEAGLNKLNNAWFELTASMDASLGVTTFIAKGVHKVADGLMFLHEHAEFARRALISLGIGMTFAFGTSMIRGVLKLNTALQMVARTIFQVNVLTAMNPGGKFISILIKLAFAIGASTLALVGLNFILGDSVDLMDEYTAKMEEYAEAHKKASPATKDLTEELKASRNSMLASMHGANDLQRSFLEFALGLEEAAGSIIFTKDGITLLTSEMRDLWDLFKVKFNLDLDVAAFDKLEEKIVSMRTPAEQFQAELREMQELMVSLRARFGDQIPQHLLKGIADWLNLIKKTRDEAKAGTGVDIILEDLKKKIIELRTPQEKFVAEMAMIGAAWEHVTAKFKDSEIPADIVDVLNRMADAAHRTQAELKNGEGLREYQSRLESIKTPVEQLREELEKLNVIELALTDTWKGQPKVLAAHLDNLDKMRAATIANAAGAKLYAVEIGAAFQAIVFQTKTVEEAVINLINAIAKALFENLILDTLVSALTGVIGTFAGNFLSGAGAGTGLTAPGNSATNDTGGGTGFGATGAMFSQGRLVPFAKGGIINSPTLFRHGTGTGVAGEAGTEAIMPLMRAANGQLGVNAITGGVNVTIIDQRGAQAPPVEVRETQGPDGQRQLSLKIRSEMSAAFDEGAMDKPMGRNFGARRTAR